MGEDVLGSLSNQILLPDLVQFVIQNKCRNLYFNYFNGVIHPSFLGTFVLSKNILPHSLSECNGDTRQNKLNDKTFQGFLQIILQV